MLPSENGPRNRWFTYQKWWFSMATLNNQTNLLPRWGPPCVPRAHRSRRRRCAEAGPPNCQGPETNRENHGEFSKKTAGLMGFYWCFMDGKKWWVKTSRSWVFSALNLRVSFWIYIYIYKCIYIYIWLLIKIPLSRNGHSSRINILLSRNFRELHVYLSRGPCWPTTPLMKIRSPPAKLRQRITDHFLVAF